MSKFTEIKKKFYANDHVVIHFASNFRVYSYRMTLWTG